MTLLLVDDQSPVRQLLANDCGMIKAYLALSDIQSSLLKNQSHCRTTDQTDEPFMLWMAFLLMITGLGISQMAHHRYHQHRQHQSAAIQGLATSHKVKAILDALNLGGCQLELLQLFNAYLTINLAPIMAIYPQHREARKLAEHALRLAETKLSPSPQLASNLKIHKEMRNYIYYASRLLPDMVKTGVLPKNKLRQWQVYLHHLLLEYELNYHYENTQLAINRKQSSAAGTHLNQAESLLKKTPFMDTSLQKNWLSRVVTLRAALMNSLQITMKATG